MPGGWNDDFADSFDIGYDGPVPAAPVLTGWALSDTSIYLLAAFVPSATGYDFYSCDSAGGNQVLLSTANTMNWTVLSLTPATDYYFVAYARNGSGQSLTYSNILLVQTKSTKPKLTMIKESIEAWVLSMTTAGGYNYTWLASSQSDLAKVAGFPCTIFEFDPLETQDRAEFAADTNSYSNKVSIKINSYTEMTAAEILLQNETALPDEPPEVYKLCMDKMLDDLKRLFGTNWYLSANTGIEVIDYVKSERVWSKSGDVLKPGKLVSTWQVTYVQSRLNPTVTAP